ncbi:phage tail tape measure protein [Rhizobium mayense]|uniref:Phage tail tape measure protein n=1 Tax=Rhizobium mayense TaxID=1312184 RepID=A0ABT7JY23_9HYPH|nr:phage tail tape measure protein [Rhizobium mayense]MDL2401249.1 phage tail tape measure protein [Rhizobium mayense]
MANSMSLDVLVRLKDGLTGPLRGLRNSVQSFVDLSKKIGLVGTAIAGISFMAPMQEAAAFQQKLVDIAGTANLSGKAAYDFVDKAKTQYEGLALKIGQYSSTIAEGAGQMIAAGLDEKLVDASIGSIGKAATAAHAEFSDMAGVATALLTTLKVPADQLDDSLAALAVAGKAGSFELKDMAKYFPTLVGQMAKFGVTGREAVNFLGAALEIAKKGTSDPAEAANNLKNFLTKILAPTTIKNFKDAGVDIQAVMQDAATKGINPIEAVVQKIVKLTGASSQEIDGLMKKAKASGLQGADALGYVRNELEKIHGAGKLGGLFSDMQVMDFLLPLLGNLDEYKDIKDQVAKATGAVTDRDFATQMQALNQQLVIFGEIGTQATREVGLAFGTWMPMINSGLEAALKWMRDLDAETGGLVRQGLAWAGAAVLVTAALGALGIVLPIVGAGIEAVAALFSVAGAAIAAVGYGAYLLYKNWGTFGPKIGQVWQRTKDGFWSFVDGMRDRGRQLLAYGSELFDRYGPMVSDALGRAWDGIADGAPRAVAAIVDIGGRIIAAGKDIADHFGPEIAAGFASAWDDIKGGWENLKTFFDGFKESLNFKIDLSGLTIDDAKVKAVEALDLALRGIAAGWGALKDFGTGFAPYLRGMGQDVGGIVNNIVEIGNGFMRIGEAVVKIAGVDPSTVSGFFKMLGDLFGGTIGASLHLIKDISDWIAAIVDGLADLSEKVAAGIDWSKLLPDGVVKTWSDLANAVSTVRNFMSFGQTSAAPGDKLPNGGTAAAIDDHLGNDDFLNPLPQLPQRPAANNNTPAQAAPAAARNVIVPALPPVTGTAVIKNEIKVTVDGPARVVGQPEPAEQTVPISSETGRAIGRL